MKPSGIGGQAVIEGVMMKNKDEYAVAIRKPNNEIVVEKNQYVSATKKYKFLGMPILRGVVAFIESMAVGMKTLTVSAGYFEEEEVKESKLDKALGKVFKEKAEAVIMGITIVIAICFAVGLFMILPFFIASILEKQIQSELLLAVVEGIMRLTIFIAYIVIISRMNDIKRVFMYHGAEHKTINCLEQGYELTVKNVRKQSKQHKRCGTSFLLYVMFFSIIFFTCIQVEQMWLRFLMRIILVPVIAGVSYEFIRLAGKNESKFMTVLSKPGLWLQNLTTREPDDSMIEVAIASVEGVFDWKSFLEKEFPKTKSNKKISHGKKKAADKKNEKSDLEAEKKAVLKAGYMEPKPDEIEEEEDEILMALDRFFDAEKQE